MRIAISATGLTLDADVDPRFGRCQHFIVVDPDTMEFEALENPNVMAAGGAGISTAQMIANLRISKEGQEGMASFLEKRKPKWTK